MLNWKLTFLIVVCHFLATLVYAQPSKSELSEFQIAVNLVSSNKPPLSRVSCDLATLKSPLPEIILVGERHWGNESSVTVKNKLLEMAAKNSFPLLIEVLPNWNTPAGLSAALPWLIANEEFTPPDYNSPAIEGIEAFVPKAIMEVNSISKQIVSNGSGNLGIMTGSIIAINLIINPIFRVSFNDIKANQPKVCSDCIVLFNQLLQSSIYQKHKRYSAEWNMLIDDRAGEIDKKEYREFVNLLHKKIIQIANFWLSRELPGFIVPDSILSEEERMFVTMQLRNKYFTLSVADSICRNHSSNFILVIVGDDHVAGMKTNLSKLINGQLRVRYFRSFDQREALSLLNSF